MRFKESMNQDPESLQISLNFGEERKSPFSVLMY